MSKLASKLDIKAMLDALGIEVTLRGKEWVAHCPNSSAHANGDQHPSWRMRDAPLSSKHGSHKCWPCGFGGGPVELVMLVRDFAERASAYEWLSKFKSGGHEEVSSIRWEFADTKKEAFTLPDGVIVKPLDKWISIARDYVRSRGITAEQVERFGLGYAAVGKYGGRIIFPARDRNGVARNYTARDFVDSEKRYLASDASERPDLGMMFGEQHWPDYDDRFLVVVVEGAINGLTVDRAVRMPFATLSGSSPHASHYAKLRTFPYVILLTDPDAAGNKVASDLEQGLGRHIQLRRALLPAGEDAQKAGVAVVREVVWHAVEEMFRTSPSSIERARSLFGTTSTKDSARRVATSPSLRAVKGS